MIFNFFRQKICDFLTQINHSHKMKCRTFPFFSVSAAVRQDHLHQVGVDRGERQLQRAHGLQVGVRESAQSLLDSFFRGGGSATPCASPPPGLSSFFQ
jgi:hypothetical protein